ncbi:MAG: SDR family oxidoreductase [Phenylobacterium sp.]|uniref:SDR family NAD(P)-dependent oxidoreductase n=1 Tax=Phenylobacterium sp. TaxID=1871053 RepID=UPI00273765F1|nr:SDR family oxidoreductase [Phenylobacterium sp.]MDP3173504.1 SDR family oxidoreductase [Phenylobacterium sp.]
MAYQAFDLTGQVALVTGGNGGIGLGMAEALAQAGADLVIWGSNPDKTAAAEARLKAIGGRVLGRVVDVSDEHAVAEGMAAAVEAMGAVHTVIANAGVSGKGQPFAETTTESYRNVLAVNLDGVFFTFREACRHMIDRAKAGDPGGSLVAISSLSAVEGAPRNEAYASTKAAVLAMTRGVAVEHARYGVRANAILPGWIATEMTGDAQGSQVFNDKVITRVPARRWGQPADFGGLAVYLASGASSFHTGDSFIVDGGYGIF